MAANINLDDLTVGQIKQMKTLLGATGTSVNGEHPYEIGKVYFIRTVTMHLIGKLEWVGNQELKLSQASWIADSGRFHDAIKTGKLNEVEPFISPVIVGRGSIVDLTEWIHNIPTEQK